MMKRGKKGEMFGVVASDKMDKTIVVKVDRYIQHPIYKRIITRSSKFKVHDPKNLGKVGNKVKIAQTRPISKEKRWRLVEILK